MRTSGKKAVAFCKFEKIEVAEKYDVGDKPNFEQVSDIAEQFMGSFSAHDFDTVHVVYMKFETTSRQKPEVMQLLPLEPSSPEAGSDDEAGKISYEFTPGEAELLNDLLPRAVKTALFQAYNDSVVSEQVMRMIAMKSASDNATSLGRTLKRDYNRARQAKITTELTEIVSGAAALE